MPAKTRLDVVAGSEFCDHDEVCAGCPGPEVEALTRMMVGELWWAALSNHTDVMTITFIHEPSLFTPEK